MRVRYGAVRASNVSISSSATADDVSRARADVARNFSTTRHQQLEGLQTALSTLSRTLYRKEPARDPAALDDSVRHAIGVAREIAAERSWWNTRWARR